MDLFYLKFIAISALFIGFYYLLMEKQKYHHFKRFYLLTSLFLSILIPFLKMKFGTELIRNLTPIIETSNENLVAISAEKQIDFSLILGFIYGVIVVFLLLRLIVNILKVIRKKRNSRVVKSQDFNLVLLKNEETPFSFFNSIYINEFHYQNDKIDPRIIVHEKTHVLQKHSWDIVLIEVFRAVFWLNPILYFYRKAIETNHEFLADQEVLKSENIKDYQRLIFNEIVNKTYGLTQTFKKNNNTKKRFIMMNTNKNKTSAIKIYSSILFSGMVIFAFAEKVKTPIFNQNLTGNSQNLALNKANIKAENLEMKNLPETKEKLMSNNKDIEKVSDTIKKKKNTNLKSSKTKIIDDKSTVNADAVDVAAEFPGGLNALRQALAMEFDTSIFDSTSGKMTTIAKLNIDENGKAKILEISGLNDVFNKEAQRCIEKVMDRKVWIPAQKDGKSVSSYYKLPFTMQFSDSGMPPPPPPPVEARKSKS